MLARVLILCGLALAGAVALGCGSGISPQIRENRHLSQEAIDQIFTEVACRESGYCATAKAVNYRLWDSIGIKARCRATKRGQSVSLLIERYSLEHPRKKLKLASYRSRPEIFYKGFSFEARNKCVMRHESVVCRIGLRGPSQVIEGITTNREDECRSGIYVAEIRPYECEEETCDGSPVVRTLFEGRPLGRCERI